MTKKLLHILSAMALFLIGIFVWIDLLTAYQERRIPYVLLFYLELSSFIVSVIRLLVPLLFITSFITGMLLFIMSFITGIGGLLLVSFHYQKKLECAICKKIITEKDAKKLYSLGDPDIICLSCFNEKFEQKGDIISFKPLK